MSDSVIVALITGFLTLVGSFIANYTANNKTKTIILFRLDSIEKKQDKHNNIIERTYKLEKEVAVLNNRETVSEHRIEDLEKGE